MEQNKGFSLVSHTQGQIAGSVSLLKLSWGMFERNWKTLVPISIAPAAFIYVGALLNMVCCIPLATVVSFLLMLAGIVLGIAMQPAALNAIDRLSSDPGALIDFRGQYKLGFKYFQSVIYVIALSTLVYFGGMIVLVIPAVVIMVYTGFYMCTLVLENKKGVMALSESFSLVKGRWFKVLGRFLFFSLIYLLGIALVAVIYYFLQKIFGIERDSFAESAVSMVLSLALGAVATPLLFIYNYKLYVSLKMTRLAVVSTAGFKKWLTAFLFVAVGVIIALLAMLGALTAGVLGKDVYTTDENTVNCALNSDSPDCFPVTEFLDDSRYEEIGNPSIILE
jgi:hypothetical protein